MFMYIRAHEERFHQMCVSHGYSTTQHVVQSDMVKHKATSYMRTTGRHEARPALANDWSSAQLLSAARVIRVTDRLFHVVRLRGAVGDGWMKWRCGDGVTVYFELN